MERTAIDRIRTGSESPRALEFHAQRLVSAIDHIPDAVFLTDAAFRVNLVNAAFHGLTGYSLEEVLGRSTAIFRSAADQAKVEEYQRAIGEGRDWIGELTNRRRDGSEYPV
jgi:PAS domain S-box-containing protein